MYHRTMGTSFPRPMGVREPSYRQSIRIPPNYSGTAVGETPPEGVSPAHDGIALEDLSAKERTVQFVEGALSTDIPVSDTPAAKVTDERQASVETVTSPLTALFTGHHFPFGHGIGREELLLLGLIFFLLQDRDADSADPELSVTLLLLGILLFCG